MEMMAEERAVTEDEFRGPKRAANLVQIDAKELDRLQRIALVAERILEAIAKNAPPELVHLAEQLHAQLYPQGSLGVERGEREMQRADDRAAEGEAEAADR
jgi:hypothetical protein